MGIDNGVKDSAPISVTAEFHKPTLRDKIQNIFNKKQSSSETFQDLAKLEPESVSKPTKPTSETSTTPIQIEDIDQQETDKKIVQIRERLGLIETKPEIETKEKLQIFKNWDSLYQQHHQVYEFLKVYPDNNFKKQRRQNILTLKKVGLKDSQQQYDDLVSRGFESRQIVDMIKGNPKQFINHHRLSDTFYEKYFKNNQTYLNNNKDQVALPPEVFTALPDSMKLGWTVISSLEPEAQRAIIDRNFGDLHINDSDCFDYFYRGSLRTLYNLYPENIIPFESRPPLPIPLEYLPPSKDSNYKILLAANVESIDLQRFIFNNDSPFLSYTSDYQLTSEVYKKYFSRSSSASPKPIHISIDAFNHFTKEEKGYWDKIKLIDNYKLQSFILSQSNDFLDKNFDKFNQPTSDFFIKFYRDKFRKDYIIPEDTLNNFSLEDQKFWKFLIEKNISLEDNKKIISDNTFNLIINNRDQIAKDGNDIDFLNNIIGMFGKKSEAIISNYTESLTSGVISKENKPLVLEFLNEFSVLTPNIIKGYKEAKQNQTEKLFISNLKEISQKLTSSEGPSESEYQSPYYQDLVQHVYSNNSGNWASYESNNSCPDRSSDLSQFNIKDVYQIDLLSQSEIKIKEGQQIDTDIQTRLESPILQVLESLKTINFDQEIGNQQLHQQADKLLSNINLPDITLSKLSIEDKLFIITSESIYHHQKINPDDIKNLLITYEFVNFEDIRNFIQGTNDKVSQASNQTYAHLCELNNFYSDRIKEVNKRIIESVSINPEVNKLFKTYFQSLSQENIQQSNQDNINKLQVNKLGLSNGFIDQMTQTLKRRSPDKKYTRDQIIRMLHLYETVTQGLSESKSTSPNKNTKAFYSQFRSQREKTFALLKQTGDDYIDPRSIHLDEINLQQAVNLSKSVENNNYNKEEFLAYTAQKFVDVFNDERSQLDTELSKYVSSSGNQREVLNAYITKTKASANARMVGGVCVSGDNPIGTRNNEHKSNLWDMPNYFQMVFQDPKTSQCLGLCLLHHFEENGKKVLTVSFNPSSTYLYSIDEASLFNGIFNQLQDFAKQNGFDAITTSQNKMIRTNRTGGVFEQTMDKKVSQFHKTFSFSEEKQFSYSPDYKIKNMDVIWERPPQ